MELWEKYQYYAQKCSSLASLVFPMMQRLLDSPLAM